MSREAQPSSRAHAFVAACVLLAATATFFVITAGKVTVPQYLPVEQRWVLHVPAGAVGMDWYSRAAASLLAGLLAAPVASAIAARSDRAVRPATARLLFGVAFGLLFWSTLYLTFALATMPRRRTPVPEAPAR